jgi:MGT family glycosyltransferase
VLFASIAQPGHLNAHLAVAHELESHGHDVAFFSHGDVSSAVAAAGLNARVFGLAEPPGPTQPARIRNDVAWLARWFSLATSVSLTPEMRGAARAAVTEFRPDVMAVDPLSYVGVAAAEEAGVPWAGLSTNFLAFAPESWTSPMREAYARIETSRRVLLESHGIRYPVMINEIMSPWLRIAFTTDAFVPGPANGVFRVGPALRLGRGRDPSAFPWDRLRADRPIVYVSSGGGQAVVVPHWREWLDVMFSALGPDEAQFVAVLHDLVDEPWAATLPSHVIGVRYAPQLDLLARASVVITQGGANTVTEALAHGVPMLVLPAVNEQSLQALLVERAGAGFTLDAATFSAATCRARLCELLRPDAPARDRARALSRNFREHDGAAHAADLVVELARTRIPLLGDDRGTLDQ